MRAVVYGKYGGPEVLQLREVDRPPLHDDQVLVRVHAASVNSWDWDLLTGKPRWTRAGSWRKPRYAILGADIAGRVEAVGKDVDDFQPGDAVFGDLSGHGWGGFAEYVSVPPQALAPKPPALSFEDAAAVPQAGILALQGLLSRGEIAAGERILINGAGGGVGTFAVQIAKSVEAEVTGVDAAAKLEGLRSLGADHVVDYARHDYARMGERYDVILDCVATRSVFSYRRCLEPGGRFVAVGGRLRVLLQVVALGPLLARSDNKRLSLLMHRPNRDDLIALGEMIEAGTLQPVIDNVYELSEAAEALRRIGAGEVFGKAVVTV